jgi:nanoRNase/pAp phosphatase (c-di-AMP/oligoRNAs hydrolase)
MSEQTNKVREFRNAVEGASAVLILTHDYPDPDCIASAYGVSELLAFWGMKPPAISFGGFVGRAENRAMIRFLNIPTVPFVLVDLNDFDRIILVDCYPGRGNVSLPPNTPIHGVIDHHPNAPPANAPFFHDIRPGYGATSTTITRYLIEAGCPISPKLATALFSGIKTDTGGMQRNATADDIDCYKILFDIMDHKLLAKIENPGRDVEFFRTLHRATEAAVSYGNIGYTHLGTVTAPDSIAEMAEFFHCWEKLEWMICTGVFKNQIFFSMRTTVKDAAGTYAEKLAEQFGGSGGGHPQAAAGRIPIDGNVEITLERIERSIMEIFGEMGEKESML